MKNKNLHAFNILFSFVLIILTSGCYTILNHPSVESEPPETNSYYSCSDCHNHHVYTDYHTPVVYPGMWDNYYIEPWWYHEISDPEKQNIPTRSIIGNRDIIIRNDHLNSNTIILDTGSSTTREDAGSNLNKTKEKTKVIQKKTEDKTSRTIKRPIKKDRKESKETNNRDSRNDNRNDNKNVNNNNTNRSNQSKRRYK